jgi:hypothetical protein
MAETLAGAMLRTFAELSDREVKALLVEQDASRRGLDAFLAMLDGRMDV